jgi:sulfatase modifying factor 1
MITRPTHLRFAVQALGAAVVVSLLLSSCNSTSVEKSNGLAVLGEKWTVPKLDLQMIPIPAGTFTMGSEKAPFPSINDSSDTRPFTRVTLTKPFWIGKTAVTVAQWELLMGTTIEEQRQKQHNGYQGGWEGPAYPMRYVSWYEAMAFCRKLTDMERLMGRLPSGYVYTLPTEAQREYACRAGSTEDCPRNLSTMASLDVSEIRPVAQKEPNSWGLYDMFGDVFEWCLDWYGPYPGGSVIDPTGALSGEYRVIRGFGFLGCENLLPFSSRIWKPPDSAEPRSGFRVVLSPGQ